MNAFIEKHWVSVAQAEFEEFLKVCDDYVRDAWADGEYYSFRRMMSHERFAFSPKKGGAVFVRPDLIKAAA